MKKRRGILISILLLLTFALSAAFTARAKEPADGNAEEPKVVKVTYINPLYKDVITEDDLVKPAEGKMSPMAVSDGDYCSVDEAVIMLRQAMTERRETVTIPCRLPAVVSDDLLEKTGQEIIVAACGHTGNPVEGDYLMYQYAGFEMGAGYYEGSKDADLTYTITYYTTAEQEEEVTRELEERVRPALGVSDKTDDAEKVRAIYEYICDNVTYDQKNLNTESYKLKYTAYAALMNGTAVCQGYAALFYRMALELKVDARVISGIGAGGPHAWNIVELGKVYFNLDST